jgi:hypothetical protein
MRATRISAICPLWTDSILPRTGPVDQSGGASFLGPCTTAAAHKLPLMSDGRLTGRHRRCINCHAAGRRTPTADTSDGNALVLLPPPSLTRASALSDSPCWQKAKAQRDDQRPHSPQKAGLTGDWHVRRIPQHTSVQRAEELLLLLGRGALPFVKRGRGAAHGVRHDHEQAD